MLFLYQTKQKQNTLRKYRIKAVIDKEKGDYIGPRALVAIIGLQTATCVSRKVENWPEEFLMQHAATKSSLITEWQFGQL